jgi:hypothetical protein
MASRLQDVILRGLAAAKPVATSVAPGTLYYSTDVLTTERSNGTVWESYSDSSGVTGINQLTGDVLAGPGTGSQASVLSPSGVTAGTFGDASNIPQVAVDAKGRVTGISNVPVVIPAGGITQLTGPVTAGPGSGSQVSVITPTGVVAGAYTNANLTVLADGRVSAAANGSAGGSGNAISSTLYGSEPGSPTIGDLDLYSNSYFKSRWNGTVWETWGPSYPFTRIVDSDFAWINQGAATINVANGGVYLKTVPDGADTLKIRKRATLTPPYTVTVAFQITMRLVNYSFCGILLRSSTGGQCESYAIGPLKVIGVNRWTSATLWASGVVTSPLPDMASLIWLRIQDNGTNRIYSWSMDGVNFEVSYTIGRTTYITPDEVGFFVNPANASYGPSMLLLSWKQTQP